MHHVLSGWLILFVFAASSSLPTHYVGALPGDIPKFYSCLLVAYDFITLPEYPQTPSTPCLQSEPLVPSKITLHWAFPTINTVTQTRAPGMVYPSPVHSLPSYLLLLFTPFTSLYYFSIVIAWLKFFPTLPRLDYSDLYLIILLVM